jgi:hypothetical protein
MAKYVSKGKAIVAEMIEAGFAEFIPSRWWTCSLALRRAVKAATVVIKDYLPPLQRLEAGDAANTFVWQKDIVIELKTGYKWHCATVGQLTRSAGDRCRQIAALEQAYYSTT